MFRCTASAPQPSKGKFTPGFGRQIQSAGLPETGRKIHVVGFATDDTHQTHGNPPYDLPMFAS